MTDVQDFIIDLENSAKRILKVANKKHIEAMKAEGLKDVRKKRLAKEKKDRYGKGKIISKEPSKKGTINGW